MDINETIGHRIKTICEDQNISINELAKMSCMTPSTIYSLLDGKSQNPGIMTIEKICIGFGITIQKFFDSDLFGGI